MPAQKPQKMSLADWCDAHPQEGIVLLAEWSSEKNEVGPDEVLASSDTRYWWKCDKGPDHEWEASNGNRTRQGSGCPYCRGLRASVTNSLASLYREIAKEWHPTKNGDLRPDDVVAGSNKKRWWKCDEGPDHVWVAAVHSRTAGSGCPCCSGRQASVTNSLASLHPELADEWHPTKNGDLKPEDVVAGSAKKHWWKCPKGPDHEWEDSSNNRTRGRNCPFCSGRRVSVTNSLASLYPDIAREWHPTKNDNLTPNTVASGSSKKHWWKCDQGPDHEWEASCGSRTGRGSGCPYCRGLRASVTNSLASLHPELADEWHRTKNGDLKPEDVVAGSAKKHWWQCDKGPDHEWQTSPSRRAQGTGCPFCDGKQVSVTNSLASLYPETAREWHPTKNGDLKPEDVVAGSSKKHWWKCHEGPDHEWEASPSKRTRGGQGCPLCGGHRSSVTNSLSSLHPEIAKEWHPTKNGDLKPDDIVAGSGKKYWWKCNRGPDHEWQASSVNRTRHGSGCPCCAGQQVSVTNSLASLYPEIAKEWHPTKNGDLKPEDVVAGSKQKCWWKCEKGPDHIWDAAVQSRTAGRGCPSCAAWTNASIRRFIETLRPHLAIMTQAELWVLLQQNGMLGSSQARFARRLASGSITDEELDALLTEVDDIVAEVDNIVHGGTPRDGQQEAELVEVDVEIDVNEAELPVVGARETLDFADSGFWASCDQEAVDFLVAAGVSGSGRTHIGTSRLR